MKEADATLEEVLVHHLEHLDDVFPDLRGHARTVTHTLTTLLPRGVSSLAAVAKVMGMSERVLQSHLQAEDTSYQQLLDGLRSDLARRYLRSSELPLLEVAMLLGYGDAAAFHRAFKRWTGETPGRYRRALQAG